MPYLKAAKEIKVLEKRWCSWAGPPKALCLDMPKPHMSNELKKWATAQGIALDFIPKEARHRLGILERPHAVRREQPTLYHQSQPKDCLQHMLTFLCRSQSPTQCSRCLPRHARYWAQPTRAKRPGR